VRGNLVPGHRSARGESALNTPLAPIALVDRAMARFMAFGTLLPLVCCIMLPTACSGATKPVVTGDAGGIFDAGASTEQRDGSTPPGIDGGRPGGPLDASGDADGSPGTTGDAGDACQNDWMKKDGQCVPRCFALPDSYQTVMQPPVAPPFGNTVWFDPNIITADDPTSFVDLVAAGKGQRSMYDRRTSSFNNVEALLFRAQFGSSTELEIQVNPEFTLQEAESEARRHAVAIGRIPAFLFAELKTVWIHKGKELYGGGNQNLLIHIEQTADYEADGVLEEVFIHEATHTSLDGAHAMQTNWLSAQAADGVAISPYARDNPTREDLAETVGPYLAVRFRPERLKPQVAEKLKAALPNRLKYLDCLGLSMEPPK